MRNDPDSVSRSPTRLSPRAFSRRWISIYMACSGALSTAIPTNKTHGPRRRLDWPSRRAEQPQSSRNSPFLKSKKVGKEIMQNRREVLLQGVLACGALLGSRKLAAKGEKVRQISLNVNGFEFEGISAGPKDGELVLFLHGFPQFADAWTNILEPLGSLGYRAVAIDQRGYSPKARPAHVDDYAVANLSADALAFADSLGAKRFHLVGHDWGGAVAWVTAASAPDRLRTLTVLSTPHLD